MLPPPTIVASMRAGAGEYLDHSAGSAPLLEALTRFSSTRTRARGGASKAPFFIFFCGQRGAGAPPPPPNTALSLQQAPDWGAFVDFAALFQHAPPPHLPPPPS